MRKHLTRLSAITLLAVLFLAHVSATSHAQDTAPTPQALLFDKPYLSSLVVPSSLHYSYKHATSEEKRYGKPFQDTIAVDIGTNDNAGGINSIMLKVFTGERQRELGPHLNMKGNPIIMVFLERDLWQMKRQVGGDAIFYRNKIRKALRDDAIIEAGEAEFGGRMIPVHKVSITPFAGETKNQRIKQFIGKSYEFTVADAVPGGFLSVRALVPAGETALIEDQLTFVEAKAK